MRRKAGSDDFLRDLRRAISERHQFVVEIRRPKCHLRTGCRQISEEVPRYLPERRNGNRVFPGIPCPFNGTIDKPPDVWTE